MQPINSFLATAAIILVINISLCHALSPPMLRGVCGAVADAEEAVGTKALAAGKAVVDIAMKPIAIAGGLKAAAVGTGMKFSGAAIKLVGAKLAKDGLLLETAGAGVKGAGLGVAALGVKPFAEKIVIAGQAAQKTVDGAQNAAEKLAKSVGDTSLQVDATLDSPFIGHHHKQVNVTSGLNTFFLQNKHRGVSTNEIVQHTDEVPIEGQFQPESSTTKDQDEQQQRVKRAAKVDPEVARATFNLIREAKLADCVCRAICDLNCNPQGFGHDGKQVFMNMVRLQGSSGLDQNETKVFHECASKGRSFTGKCEQCSTEYKECKSKSVDLIKMASHIRLD